MLENQQARCNLPRLPEPAPECVLLFRRDFPRFTGGELKVRHYFAHAERSTRFRPRYHLAAGAGPEAARLWGDASTPPLAAFRPEEAAALFLAGVDWSRVPDPAPVPVVNLIQHVRHADPGTERWSYLSRPATRICVSEEVKDAILATGRVVGPVHVIEPGTDPADLPPVPSRRDVPVVIAGVNHVRFARALCDRLAAAGIVAECIVEWLPRRDFLERLARACVAVTLPSQREGFFLPAIEAMALGAITVCPDCIGNRGFCRDGETAFRPAYEIEAVVAATKAALALDPVGAESMRTAAAAEASRHSLEAEREAFLRILDALEIPPDAARPAWTSS